MRSGDEKPAGGGGFFAAISSSVRSWGSAMQKSVNGYGSVVDRLDYMISLVSDSYFRMVRPSFDVLFCRISSNSDWILGFSLICDRILIDCDYREHRAEFI